MHIGLLLGVLVLLAVVWLIHNARRSKTDLREPAAMLLDEIGKRRAAQAGGKRARERLEQLKATRLRPVEEGVRGMIRSLPDGMAGAARLELRDEKSCLKLDIFSSEKQECLVLEWDIQDLDLDLFADSSLESMKGDYIIRMEGGDLIREADFSSFMRRLGGLIADRLA